MRRRPAAEVSGGRCDGLVATQPARELDARDRRHRLRFRRDSAHGGRHVSRSDAAGPRRGYARARLGCERRREDAHVAHREIRERDAGRAARPKRLAQQPEHRVRLDGLGNGSERRANARAAAGPVRDGCGAEVARRPAAVRPAVRSDERAGAAGRRHGRRPHRSAALRLRDELHRAAPGRHPGRGERGAERRHAAADQRHRRSRRRPVTRRDSRGHQRGCRAIERAPSVGRVHLARLRRQRLHERGPTPREDDRRRAREGGRTAAPSTSATSRACRTAARPRRRPCRSTARAPST